MKTMTWRLTLANPFFSIAPSMCTHAASSATAALVGVSSLYSCAHDKETEYYDGFAIHDANITHC
jgi:hypothetical protein